MKKIWRQLATGLFMAGWMVIIFSFSAQPAVESTELSGTVAYRLLGATEQVFRVGFSGQELLAYAEEIEYPIRKAAHMTEYAIMGLLSFAFYAGLVKQNKIRYLLALCTSMLYAVTDEIHQLFVPGRTGQFIDVCIDTTGAAIGLLLLALVWKIIRKHCEKKKVTLQ